MSNHNPPTNGFDKRKHQINRKGRPKSFDDLRALAKQIANEKIESKDGKQVMSRVELIMRQWAGSGNDKLARAFIEYAYGKVPDETKLSGEIDVNADIFVTIDQ